jgi:glycosyltransferase involved in cell wall biosynthesis
MRVLITTDPISGIWTYAVDLSRELVRDGHEAILASMGGRLTPDQRQCAETTGATLIESAFRLEWMDEPWSDVDRAGEWLLELEAQTQPDVIHLNGYAHATLPWRAPRIICAHSCVVSRWWAVQGEDPPPQYSEYRRRVRAGLRAARTVVAPSRFMRDQLIRHYGEHPDARVISNGRAHDRFHPQSKWPYIASAGRLWDPAKNLDALVAAAPGLPWPLYLAGPVEHPDANGEVTERPDSDNNRVRFLGQLSEERMGHLFGHAAIYVHPARYEPFGLTVLEAAFAGCALVLSELPSLLELWEDSAVFVDTTDPRRIRDAIRLLARQPSALSKLAARARARALRLSSKHMAAAYAALYNDVCAPAAA